MFEMFAVAAGDSLRAGGSETLEVGMERQRRKTVAVHARPRAIAAKPTRRVAEDINTGLGSCCNPLMVRTRPGTPSRSGTRHRRRHTHTSE